MNTSPKADDQKPFGPIIKEDWEVSVDTTLCIGAGICTAIAAKTFEMDEDNKAVILRGIEEESSENILDAAKACPVAAIIIKTKAGEKIFPH